MSGKARMTESGWESLREFAAPECWWFQFKLKSDTGIYHRTVWAPGIASAVKQVMDHELCPERSILEIRRRPNKRKKAPRK